MVVTNVQLFSIPVADQDRAGDFYVTLSACSWSPTPRWARLSGGYR